MRRPRAELDGEPTRASAARATTFAACLAALLALPAASASAAPPSAATDAASAVGDRLATMHGRVNPGGVTVESCLFEYGTTTAYGAYMPCIPGAAELGSGSGDITVSATTLPLEPGAAYHYRLVASNAAGEVGHGQDRTFATAGTPLCPNVDRRVEQGIGSVLLPGCMALEMVSPPMKFNQPANSNFVSADGGRVKLRALAALADTPNQLGIAGDVYVAERGEGAWLTRFTSPPAGLGPQAGAAQSFTPDLSGWFHVSLGFLTQTERGISQVFRGGLGDLFSPLSSLLVPIGPPDILNEAFISSMGFYGASSDHSRAYFSPGRSFSGDRTTSYIPGDPVPRGPGEDRNVYVAQLDPLGEPSLTLLARDTVGADAGKAWGGNCGARVGGIGPTGGTDNPAWNGTRNQGAISPDGSHVYFSTRAAQPQTGLCSEASKMRILKRTEAAGGQVEIKELIESECDRVAPACKTEAEVNGDDLYQGASVDQTRVYFTTNRQLADSDLDGGATQCSGTTEAAFTTAAPGCDLYLYDSTEPEGERLTQVSAGETNAQHEAGKEAKVFNSIAAISGDGSRAYFVAHGALTDDPNPAGKTAEAGKPNFYAWDAEQGSLDFIGVLASGDSGALWSTSGGTFGNRAYPVPVLGRDSEGTEVGGDGHLLIFQSKASLTQDDGDNGFRDIFRYDAAAVPPTLERLTKAEPGGVDDAPFDAEASPGGGTGTDFAESGRRVSEDGQTVVFTTAAALLPDDVNEAADAYLLHGGRLARLPLAVPNETPALSHDGSTVAFSSPAQLLPQDGDTITDVYVARVGGGFPHIVPPICDPIEGCRPSKPPFPSAIEPSIDHSPNPTPNRPCGASVVKARGLGQRAERLRQEAGEAESAGKAKRMRRRARRLDRQAQSLSRKAKKCRRDNRGAWK